MNEYSMISCPVFPIAGNVFQDPSSLLCAGISAGHELIAALVYPINVLVAPLGFQKNNY
ncbi:hypothetical protein H9X96_13855 [Pedobacter sp. N36a]|nr:hypothetical protein [Pedobacter sp. N36a]